uniref:Glutathione peroxidase n=2 Tax=Elaeis guineensis var. tenera TaxID=51953 RepID=A0A6I9RP74_ELAGV|nr:probable phospholipid hydroperoxide glutathione peroxidase isoform X1 [Elaeis guineensis]
MIVSNINFSGSLDNDILSSSTPSWVPLHHPLLAKATEHMQPSLSWPVFFLGLALLFFGLRNPAFPGKMAEEMPKSIYDITVKDINGNDVNLSTYNGKVLLIVNVASKCGFTHSNYKEMNILYEKYKDKGFEIFAFPCNQFGGQEPGSNEEIQEVACRMFKAEFPIFDKIEVNGKNAAPLYKYLKSQKGSFLGDSIKWNFTKFLVDKNGRVVERYAPTTSPLKIEMDIQKLLEGS